MRVIFWKRSSGILRLSVGIGAYLLTFSGFENESWFTWFTTFEMKHFDAETFWYYKEQLIGLVRHTHRQIPVSGCGQKYTIKNNRQRWSWTCCHGNNHQLILEHLMYRIRNLILKSCDYWLLVGGRNKYSNLFLHHRVMWMPGCQRRVRSTTTSIVGSLWIWNSVPAVARTTTSVMFLLFDLNSSKFTSSQIPHWHPRKRSM